ncbi:hypothetical protein DQG23_33290 [Paenibacillus contaminans]|uniref:Uncharacterized protein n=1 Tax=Paenibacillus contaminans TaxID=450362 RepID=A0A329LZ46_9BACL|nr:hypothetical protein DQG23_33290 [Paenibacillus contaminans]
MTISCLLRKQEEEVFEIKMVKIGALIVFAAYLVLMATGLFRGTLTVKTGLFWTAVSCAVVVCLFWLSKLFAYINRKLYEKLRRMMK